MKKLLALVLALVMTMSLAVSANAAFSDADKINESYAEAANVLTGMGVLKGYEDGSFKPEGAITRAEVAAVVYRIYTADVTDKNVGLYTGYGKFNDLTGANWAKGYIGYCANAGLVRGYNDTTFGPLDNVTGYQALAMILRAMGYDKNGEFAGKDWQLHVAQTAQQLGILKNAGSENLAAPASRQLVAELLFQAIQKPCVSYTPAFGYVPNTVVGVQQSLGTKNFTLTLKKGTKDVWGRPSHTWTYTTGDTETVIAQKADAVYYTKVDECDIAKDLGISSAKAIEKAFIDGVETSINSIDVTTDRNGKIDPLNTTSLVGAQGRLTEVYEMEDGGYRIVEINTYLGKVTKVTAATTDRNGHTTAATINVKLCNAKHTATAGESTEYTFKATGYTVGQWVLVNATFNNPVTVRIVNAATVTPMGLIKNWTNAYGTVAATTTVAETKYNDADKFFHGNFKLDTITGKDNTAYDTIVDAYGNLIGLVPSTINYLVIEKIEWKHDTTAIGGGVAKADFVLANGEKVSAALVASVNGYPTSNTSDSFGNVPTAYVSDSYVNNTNYYKHIFTYAVNADGTYALNLYCYTVKGNELSLENTMHNTDAVKFVQHNTAYIKNTYKDVVANDNTKFLVLDSNGYTYTVYNGIDELPSMTVKKDGLCFLANGVYASLVVIKDYELASSSFVAYIAKQNGWAEGFNSTYYTYNVTKLGATDNTILKSKTLIDIKYDGFYEVTLDANGFVKVISDTTVDVTPIIYTYGYTKVIDTQKSSDYYWDRGIVKAFDGKSPVLCDEAGVTAFDYTYRVNDNTEYYVVTKTIYTNNTESTSIVKGDKDSVAVGDKVVVVYTSTGAGITQNVAAYIYVLKTETQGQNYPTKGDVNFYVQFVDIVEGKLQYREKVLVGTQTGSDVSPEEGFNFSLEEVYAGSKGSWTGKFTWDEGYIAVLKAQGYTTEKQVYHVVAGQTTDVVYVIAAK